ncbi:MAG TPA: SMC-Scp complex subunit ScpB [Candidatus Eremiobacteraceae bacterium]|nr:SMC-Scp complex subunit ScpB [Candidatus Eremiobacteraceae bacterium]
MPSLRNRLEAVLFVASEPATMKQLCAATGADPAAVQSALTALTADLRDRGMTLREVGGGWRLTANPTYREDVERFLLPPKTHISPAALEALAIVAYLQPVTRPEIESLRGVVSDSVIDTLEQRGFIGELGRKDVVGRPILYGTTEFFLESFDLKSLDDLPPLPEGAPVRVDGQVIQLPLPDGREKALEQIHDSVEGHEDEITAIDDATLRDNVALELERALSESA